MIGNVDILKRIHLAKAVHLALVHSHTQKVSISAVTDTLRRFASDLFLIYLVTYVYCQARREGSATSLHYITDWALRADSVLIDTHTSRQYPSVEVKLFKASVEQDLSVHCFDDLVHMLANFKTITVFPPPPSGGERASALPVMMVEAKRPSRNKAMPSIIDEQKM